MDREAGAVAVMLIIAMLAVAGLVAVNPTVPACPEDVVLVGQGQFEAGRWERYVCGPAVDDFAGNWPS